jgi:hypothetical protein
MQGLLNIDTAYAALAEAKEAASHDIGVDFLARGEFAWAKELLAKMDAGLNQLLAVAAAFDTLEDIKTGRLPQEL